MRRHGQRACQMHCVGTTQFVLAGKGRGAGCHVLGPFAFIRRPFVAAGRFVRFAGVTTPSRSRRLKRSSRSAATRRATGTPRSVTTTRSRSRARSTYDLRFAHSSLIAMSTPSTYG